MNASQTGIISKALLWILMIFLLISQVYACEPAVPLGQVALFPGAIAKSLYLLVATVIVKTVAFVVLERSLPWWKAAIFIVLANIATTTIGVAAVIPLSAPALIVPLGLILGFVAYVPAKGLAQRYFSQARQKLVARLIVAALCLVSVISGVSFLVAKRLIEAGNVGQYWIAKVVSVYAGLIFGFLITIFYEEWCVSRLAKRKDGPTPFLTSVTRANLVALLFMMTVTAILVLPEKIQNQDYGFLK